MRALERRGPLRVDAVASTINLVSRYHFGGIAVRRDYLRVGFVTNHVIKHQRISRVQQVGARRFHHDVVLRSARDLDDRLLGWLGESQAMQARPAGARDR